MKTFTLYLDESEIKQHGHDLFAVGGVAVDLGLEAILKDELTKLKKTIWHDDTDAHEYVLHEKEMSAAKRFRKDVAPHYEVFKTNAMYNKVYIALSKIIQTYRIPILGVCLNRAMFKQYYSGDTNHQLTIAIQLLLENYCNFLAHEQAVGSVCYEALDDIFNKAMRQRFCELQAMGTLYYTSTFFQEHITGISFLPKKDNVAGLQLADFVPNTFARSVANMKPKHKNFRDTLFKNAYDGGLQLAARFGLKRIP